VRIDAAALEERLTGLDRAARAADGRLPGAEVRTAREVLERAAQRRALAPDLTVVALAGPTGAGKSTLFNAIVGQPIARAAVIRPTTAEPMAALWTTPHAAAGLLDWLGVPRWHVVDGTTEHGTTEHGTAENSALEGLVLLDLPDHDSTHVEHRALVDHLVARVDVMVWVLDPQKYGDALVHDAYLKHFARHSAVTVVLLNQADQLTPADLDACVSDLRGLVASDGLPDARVLAVSASTGSGIAEVHAILAGAASARQASLQRLAADVAAAAEALRTGAADNGTAVGVVPRAHSDALAEALTEAAGVRLIEDAVRASVRMRGGRATGWPPVRWTHRLRRDPVARLRLGTSGVDPALIRTSLPSASPVAIAGVAAAAREYAAAASRGAPPAWVRSARAVAVAAAEGIGPHLDSAVARAEVGGPRVPRWWAAVGALQWGFLALAAVGALWLLGLIGLRALAIPAPEPPLVGAVPVPTALLLAGVVIGLVLSALAGLVTRATADRAARRARSAVTERVAEVARVRIADPVSEEMATLAEFRIGLVAAAGG
jgi:GTPase Era involved in 16S rRNA processing/multisubunit Na+/H+ antiporter MnhC subunit